MPVAAESGATIAVGDKGYAGRDFAAAANQLGITILRPARRNEPDHGPHLAPIRQRIESVFQTCKDILTLERHGARTLHNLKARIATRLLALAASIWPTTTSADQAAPSPTSPHSAESII